LRQDYRILPDQQDWKVINVFALLIQYLLNKHHDLSWCLLETNKIIKTVSTVFPTFGNCSPVDPVASCYPVKKIASMDNHA